MQFRLISGFLIFIGSYLPLAIILAVQDIPKDWWSRPICSIADIKVDSCSYVPFEKPVYALTFLAVTGLSVLMANVSFKKLSYPFQIEVVQAKAIPNELINYTFPYVVSFMGISYNEPQKLLGFAVFLLWMFAITYKSGQILMNPLLLMFKWRLHEATILINGNTREVRILKQGNLTPGPQKGETVQDFYIVRD
ncbi:hypothetical protein RY831_32675 [Noviherbaspirillum sp. CPCC 100848]|uniref:Uncharacterized protein n=1 Tax=Noviherbaspirillum album TaxID=3080276 RepID=A0ABU6JJJ4_9BURK|nr:hypothetical protein [Noviherbaspirillum sp. CPCC 100848]MEC4723863.1 hypothetical protein [Noviherbaspirillum sp. CPCC 100848]